MPGVIDSIAISIELKALPFQGNRRAKEIPPPDRGTLLVATST
jgi:hypothetical protein